MPEEHVMGRLVSVNVGLPRDVEWRGQTVRTAIWKEPVQGRRIVRRLNVDGDGQGDLAGHGGEHRAVMVYQMDSYRYWEKLLGRNDFVFGQFGENFTVEGLSDDEVCVGDRYRIGTALFEVTQPRVTCYRVGIRMGEPAMASLLVSHHRPGFYFRVLEEGEVGAGDEIVKMADGPERMSVAGIDALLYLPDPPHEQLERSLRIPALSPGWQGSLKALADKNPAEEGPPAWSGFRPLRVQKVERESRSVVSVYFEAPDGSSLPAGQAGQFLVLRLRPSPDAPPLIRNYSLSGSPDAKAYRVSVKQEVHGAASSFIHDHVQAGDVVEVSAPRGSFTLKPGDGPVVLVSAGIGATPVLAMLHFLSHSASTREVWWLYGARNGEEHPFALESHELLQMLPRGRGHIVYSKPRPADEPGVAYDSPGRLDVALLARLGVAREADYYLCGPPSFLQGFTSGLTAWGAEASRVHFEVFGPEEALTPGIAKTSRPLPHAPPGDPGSGPLVAFTRSGLTVKWNSRFPSLLELAEACDVPVKWSCRTGVCHNCESVLVGGSVGYQPVPLEPPAEGNLLICCSRPLSEVEIDL